jgi:hypothetical protein
LYPTRHQDTDGGVRDRGSDFGDGRDGGKGSAKEPGQEGLGLWFQVTLLTLAPFALLGLLWFLDRLVP